MSTIAKSAVIYPNVTLGENVVIEDFCIIGLPVQQLESATTIIGDNAVIRAGTYIYAGNIIGNDFQTGNKANIREDNIIGDNVSVGTLTVIEHHVTIGNGVRIHSQCFIPEYTTLEQNSWIGPNVVITNARFPKHPDVKSNLKGAHVHADAKIGANATILPGVIIGKKSLVGAGSVVTKHVDSSQITAGNPAKVIRGIDY